MQMCPVMISPTFPSTSSIMCLVSLVVTCPYWSAIPDAVADRMNRFGMCKSLIFVDSNNEAIL